MTVAPELINNLPHIFYKVRVLESCTLKSVSPQCLAWLGYTPQELQRDNCNLRERVIHPDDQELVAKMRRQSLGSESLTTLEYRLLTKTGNILRIVDRWISYRSTEDGCWIVEGQFSEAGGGIKSRLVNQLKAYRDAVDVNLISSITDRTGRIIYANKNFCKISKYSASELMGQNHRIICSGHHSRAFYKYMWKTITSGKLWHGEIMNKAKDGSLYWVDTVIIPIFDDNKRIEKYLSLRMLITDRKRSEEQRSKYTESLERIAFMVAHNTRGPLCSILGLTHILVNQMVTPKDAPVAFGYLKEASDQLDDITKKLSHFVYENEIELKGVDVIAKNHDYLNKS